MKLTLRISVILLAFAVTVFSAFGWYLMTVESADLRTAARHEAGLIARSLQVAIENALRDRQLEDVRETIDKMRTVEPGLFVGLFDPSGAMVTSSNAERSADYRPILQQMLQQAPLKQRIEFEADEIVVAQPLFSDHGERVGAFVMGQPIERLNRDLAATRRNIISNVLVVVVGVALVTVLAGLMLIGRPLGRLVGWMRRIRESGSLAVEIAPAGAWDKPRDEIRALEDEFSRMLVTLRQTQTRLEQQTSLREQLERSLRRMDKLASIGQLAAGLAHEIGSPLQILNGRAQALLEQSTDAEVQRQAKILVDQSDRISRIVAQLLSNARRHPPQLAPHDVVPLVRAVTEFVAIETKRKDVQLALHAPARVTLCCDADLLQQVTLNLLTNALRATPRGGTIDVAIEEARDLVTISVTDNGPGVPEALRASLFEPFFTASDDGSGTGLGLAIVRSIVHEHGGSVELDPDYDAGARMVVRWRKEAVA